jgi:uncharacterized Ntn-hydrolase superfamily protein
MSSRKRTPPIYVQRRTPLVATFSIVGHDPRTGDLGIAVQSKFLAVGAVVPWARAGVGAIATQSWANTTYGPDGLALLEQGLNPQEVIEQLTAGDDRPGHRQVGIVDAQGRSATFTGEDCFAWAGGIAGPHFAAQGNILVSEETVQAMAQTFLDQQTSGVGELADHLMAALAAGQAAGGDSRGMQSAALLVVRAKGGYSEFNDRYVDLRVEDHPSPINELRRILDLHHLYFQDPDPNSLIPLEGETLAELRRLLQAAGYLITLPQDDTYDPITTAAFDKFTGRENLEDRMQPGALIDPVVLKYLRGLVEDEPAPDHEPAVHVNRPGDTNSHADHGHLHIVRRSPSQAGEGPAPD